MIILKIKNQQIIAVLILLCIFLFNLCFEYNRYLSFIHEEVFETKAEVINIYKKDNKDILKLKASNFEVYTNAQKNEDLKRFDMLNILIVSKNISFLQYLKGFYTTTIYFDKLEREQTFKYKIIKNVQENHKDEKIVEFFNALFLAVPTSKELMSVFTNYGITHVVAISGFHLVVLSFVIYWILYYPYKFFQNRYFPYRNRRLDILLITMAILFYYLILTDIVPSFLRAFIMFCLGIYLLRSNIKIVSYMTLFFTFLIVIAIFPKYIFSIGFWFSTFAVFYIYLFLQYFQNYNKYFLFIFFNIWMFLVFNPIVHFYFSQTSYEQFYSIPITLFFNIFYPFEIVAHIFGFSGYFDKYINMFLEYKIYVFEVLTPLYFYILYLLASFFSIFSKIVFYILNILMLGFNIYMYF